MSRLIPMTLVFLMAISWEARAQTARQPKVQPGPSEPDWVAILDGMYGLALFGDLKNPVETTPEATPGLLRKAGPGPVTYTPVIALGLETITRGGWYRPKAEGRPQVTPLWSYQFKNTAKDIETGANLPPPLLPKANATFDPGDEPFGLWVSNDQFPGDDGIVFTQPQAVAAVNKRLAKQPYKAMIYPAKDKATGKVIPHSVLIGWEYSTNDDFQDVVCRVDNVELVHDRDADSAEK
ncbi:MAG TPA: hypothetical protein VF590_26870 [Isosphaeraceae bacterium]|jgi:hypothetical protein